MGVMMISNPFPSFRHGNSLMLFQPCPVCGALDAVNSDPTKPWDPPSETCTCEECGARFEIEPDGEWVGQDFDFRDCSTVGKRIMGD
jgi:hypothetical protein